ncbi:MAG TPA: SLC13 family permease [Verrucomicrobiales bacterium]|nr:SLC13 family permease [Verrucomicrobiales bacterium]HIL83115.1 SLC13 family permease [Pseudomonadales bacterium]
MNTDQIILFSLLFFVFVFLIWGRWRYDLVAFVALVVGLIAGVVPKEQAFTGFGHPATIVVALVLIISRALYNSGAVELMARYVVSGSRKLSAHICVMSGLAAALSALMNNVAALAMLMPVDLQAAAKAKRSPSLTLMPLSFASILGGMITLIGTPPNIVISEFRNNALGSPYKMFDFAPVGLVCATVGVLFVATVGWRLIPVDRRKHNATQELFDLEGYIAEVKVPEGSSAIDRKVRELDEIVEDCEVEIVGLFRRGQRLPGLARQESIRKNDLIVLKAKPDGIEKLVGVLGLEYVRGKNDKSTLTGEDLSLQEVVVPEGARVAGRSGFSHRLLSRHGITLLGISRQGKRFTERVRKVEIRPGDILLLLGPSAEMSEKVNWMGCLPLAERGLQVLQRGKAGLAVGAFAIAVLLASIGVLYLPIALAAVVAIMAVFNVVPLRQIYESVEWSVVVLLGSMIPIGVALEASGGTQLIANGIVDVTTGLPAWAVLTLLILVTMTLSDVMNNTATAVIAAPVALDIAKRLDVSPDPFLMGVAVAASCAFLTPIGHKNNTLILGPGGYRFGDYWRMGLPLELLIVFVSTPAILWVWPL